VSYDKSNPNILGALQEFTFILKILIALSSSYTPILVRLPIYIEIYQISSYDKNHNLVLSQSCWGCSRADLSLGMSDSTRIYKIGAGTWLTQQAEPLIELKRLELNLSFIIFFISKKN
jgi:hypothetical protein